MFFIAGEWNGTHVGLIRRKHQVRFLDPRPVIQEDRMNLNFLCCIGAELKNSTQQTTRMTQVYLYRAFETETVDDMLSPGFFNAALGILRLDDLLLLYGPNDSRARYVYARVSEITRSGVVIEKVNIDARDIYVNTDDMSNLHKHTLQEVIAEIDAEITRLDDRIDEEIERAKAAEGDMQLPIIIDGAPAPTNLSEAIRQLNEQTIDTITQDDQAPTPGNWKLWDAIKKCFSNAVYFFAALVGINARLNALEGRGGPVGAYDFGKAMDNPISDADQQTIIGVMIDNIWTGHTPIEWKTPIYDSSFNDSLGVAHTAADIFNATWIRNTFDGTRLVLTNTLDTDPKVFSIDNVGVDVVSFANTTTAGIVRTGVGSDMTTDQTTGDISINDSKGFSIWNRITSLFTPAQQAQIRSNLGLSAVLPVGMIIQHAGPSSTPPEGGWALCDGRAVPRVGEYANLFAVIGTTYGAGDGNSTFNLPDARDVALIWPANVNLRGTQTTGQLPKIEGSFGFTGGQWGNPGFGLFTGVFAAQYSEAGRDTSGDGYRQRVSQLSFSAARSSSAYIRNDNRVLPASLFIGSVFIKY